MDLIRVGHRIYNLDLVRDITYHDEAARLTGPMLSFDYFFGEEPVSNLYGDDARAVWAMLCRQAAVPEMVPAADDGDNARMA